MRTLTILLLVILALCRPCDASCNTRADGVVRPSMEDIRRATGADGDSMRRYAYSILQQYDFYETLDYARQLYHIGKKYGDQENVVYGAALAGMSCVFLRDRDSAYIYLREAVNVGEKIGFDWGLASAYNGMGLYQLNFGDSDHYTALESFSQGLEAAKRGGNEQTYTVILCNIANVYFLRGDPSEGLPYAQECYDRGLELQDEYLTFTGSQMLAYLHYMLGDYEQALGLITVTEDIVLSESPGTIASPYKAVMTFTLYGNILSALGEDAKAVYYFEKALDLEVYGDLLDFTYLSYGDYFLGRGRYRDALKLFHKGAELAVVMDNNVYASQLYRKISECYEKLGDFSLALQYHKLYYEISQNIFSAEKERSLSEMRIRYEVEKKEAEIARNHLDLLQQKRRTQVYALLALLILFALGGTFYYYQRKNMFYREIFRQSQVAVKARARLESTKHPEEEQQTEKYANSPLSDSKGRELFQRLESLMEKEKLYRDGKLTVDRLAEILGSNRSYLSRTINEYSGYNFNNFVNSYRINEAVRILSLPDGDIPLKALAVELGFNTLTTFYSSFQKEIGMPPSRYRKMVVENQRGVH